MRCLAALSAHRAFVQALCNMTGYFCPSFVLDYIALNLYDLIEVSFFV
jgi:hypothetical protein